MAGLHCNKTLTQLVAKVTVNLDADLKGNVSRLCDVAYKADVSDKFSKPLLWIGMYIASGSALCVVAMLADWFFAPNRRRQIPYKHFSLNAATITVLSIAMKLPLDMTGEMPGFLDQATKLGSLVFMCTMLANLIPNLASMDNKTLVSNLVAVAILVITISVNILVEMITGVIDHKSIDHFLAFDDKYRSGQMRFHKTHYFVWIAFIYIVFMLLLLLISISAAISIPSMKKVLEHQYQVRMETLREGLAATTLVELKEHVTKYWIMAKTGSPHFVLTASPLFVTSCIICIASTSTYIGVLGKLINRDAKDANFGSDYRWSMAVILITQFFGIIIGDFTLLSRYINSIRIHDMSNNLSVEKYWYARLCEWKGRHIAFPQDGRRRRTFVHTLKNSFLNLCIKLQTVLLVMCKILEFVSVYFRAIIRTCRRPLASLGNKDLENYVLCVDDKPIDKYALHFLLEFKNRLVKKAEKKENSNLLDLLRKSNGFKEGQNFATHKVQIPPSVTLESWSLPVVTLTCIAMVVPDSQDQIDGLIKSVDQALVYAHLVEESFNSEQEYANMHKRTMDVWCEVKDACKWLKTSLRRDAFQEMTPTHILKWFHGTAEAIVTRKSSVVHVEPWENYPDYKLICESMQSISSSILSKYQNGTQLSKKVEFFKLLSSMIADILFACLSNIPQVITTKCHVEKIEKREASVEAAVKILARTIKMLETLETPKLPILDRNEMERIDEWRCPLIQPELR
ncbi:hypothetical protein Tco_1350623 [Tanacetum coccineum]